MPLWGKVINLNNFKTDILAYAIEEPQFDLEDKRDGRGELRKPKEFSHKKWTQWEDSIYNYFAQRKNSLGVPLILLHQKGYIKSQRQ